MRLNLFHFLFRWGVIIATLAFVGVAFFDHWQAVKQLEIRSWGWLSLSLALGVNLMSHLWSGIVWGWILRALQYPRSGYWSAITFLVVELAKYLPGDIWQVYARVHIAHQSGIPLAVGTVSIILESLYLTTTAAAFGLLITTDQTLQVLCGLSLGILLLGIHPRVFDWVMNWLHRLQLTLVKRFRFKQKGRNLAQEQGRRFHPIHLRSYPLPILVGMMVFMGLRSLSFLLTGLTLSPLPATALAPAVGGFSLAWTLGIVMPGISGGVGLFEATAIAMLDEVLPMNVVLGTVILYRLNSLCTEAVGAAIGWVIKGNRSWPELNKLPRQ